MPYWAMPEPQNIWNKSELHATLCNYDTLGFSTKDLRGPQLASLLSRLERGVLLYATESNADLAQTLLQHSPGSIVPETKPANKYRKDVIAALDHAEAERTFHGFTSLPPELRQRIYTFAFSYSDNAYHLQQPAVSRVCRLLRIESLPVFYETNRFGIQVERTISGVSHRARQVIMDVWPTYISAQHIAMMRYFEVVLVSDKARIRIKVDLPNPKGGADDLKIDVWSITPEKFMTPKLLAWRQGRLDRLLPPVIEGLLKDPGLGAWSTKAVQLMALSVHEPLWLLGMSGKTVFQL